tara:strand:- start:739 stop:843 length:105 start_codon:yes stop_codon:yes gene_type:complete
MDPEEKAKDTVLGLYFLGFMFLSFLIFILPLLQH